jgi:hypothetical protein
MATVNEAKRHQLEIPRQSRFQMPLKSLNVSVIKKKKERIKGYVALSPTICTINYIMMSLPRVSVSTRPSSGRFGGFSTVHHGIELEILQPT